MDISANCKEPSEEYQEETEILKAEVIYVILKKSSNVSRSLRIQWFLQHLNTKIRITQRSIEDEDDPEAAIVSIIPQEPPKDWSSQNAHLYKYMVLLSTNVIFLGEVYRQVYCLDISPSVSTVDIQQGEVLLDVIIKSLRKSIKFLIKPFLIPGSSHLFHPDIFITVIAHTPFYISPAQQVLVQGWKITEDNVDEFLEAVLRQLEFIEDAVAQVSGAIHDQFERERKKSLIEQLELKKSTERIFNDDHENSFTPSSPNIAMVSPGSGFLNLLRYGMLALKLLPVSNFSNLVVITDGMIIMPDTDTLDSVLNHMRYNDIACYFLHVGSQFHPHCGFGFVPYTEIMQLISVATNGAYLQFPPQHKQTSGLNVYQYNFLTWNLKRKSVVSDLSTPFSKDGEWGISNRHFCGNRGPQLLLKKYLENDINVTVYGVLACRIREGFILKDIFTRESELIINFILPWTNHIYIEYTLSCQWPVVSTPSISTHYVINIKAPYEFLHDISCRNKGPIKSPFRQALIARFWRSLKSFAQSDLLLSHLESFVNNVGSYYLPEILKNGMPLYHLTPGSCQPNVGSSDVGFSQFGTIWRPACLLNNNLWQKWFHADRVGVIFKHDEPLNLFPQNFQTATMTCAGMQCRQATNTLFNFLKSYCSFVLIENHSFIKFLLPNESGTGKHSFVVIRSIFKPPYAVIHLAFLYNIPGRVRLNFLKHFKRSICALKIPRLSSQKDSYDIMFGFEKSNIIVSNFNSQTNCCILLDKPLEKILIRYEQMPKEFKTVVFPDGTQPSAKSVNPLFPNRGLITTLSRYLHHRRWIWKTGIGNSIFLPISAVKTVLSTLVKIRLQEGFYFAHCSAGICNMVLEVQMKGLSKDRDDHNGVYYDYHNEADNNEELHSCIIQYVIFSPRTVVIDKEGNENNENEAKIVELISECWIEPQNGVITGCPTTRNYMSNLQYHQLPDALWSIDAKCISALFTFEYLRLICENTSIEIPDSIQNLLTQSNSSGYWPNVAPFADQRISQIPFAYSVPNLLCQCVQEILHFNLFSVDILEKCDTNPESNKLLLDSIYNHLSSVNDKELVFCGQDAKYFIKNFRRNFRCAHHSACGLFHASDSHLSLSSSSDRFGVVPTSHDWDRMTSWAMNENDFAAGSRTPLQYNQSEMKPHRHPSEVTESLYSSNFDISSVSNIENADWLKWKCYIKFTASSICLVTVMPDSLDVIQRLFLDHKNAAQMMSESLYFDVDSRIDPEEMHFLAAARNDSCSFYTSCSTSSKELDEADETADRTPESSAFRLRASTWDPVRGGLDPQGNIVDRMRTNSLGARMKPLTRLRPKRSFDFDSKERLSENVFQASKYAPLILPVYVCKCSLTDVINYLIYKNECNCEDNFKNTQQGVFGEDETIAGNRVEEQCRNISEMFTKMFIISLFKCLHQGYDIPANDVEQAFSKCETSVLTIDITDYIKVVCRHVKHFSTNTSENEKKEIKPSSYFISSVVCNELRFIHRLIKKKFTNILTLDFKPVASKPEFYYFFPSWTKESKPSSVGMLSPGLNETPSNGISVEHMIPVTSANILGAWETCKESVNSEDNACTSLISNMDSDSLNEVSNESLMDDLNPLFLKLDCNIFSENNSAKCTINVIPTCICEILKQLDKPFDLNVGDFRVTMDLLCLTSPYVDVKKKAHKSGYQENSCKSFSPDDFNKSSTCESIADGLSFEDGCVPSQLAQLPDYQYNALNTCVAQMKWLMKDEIVTFMLDTSPVTSDTLKMVCDHIASSSNATTCFIEKVPLSFVFGKETTSINNFLQDFDHLKIPNYQLKKEKNIYYLTKNSNEKQRLFPKKDFEDYDFADFTSDMGRMMTGSMEIVNEEQENFLQVFSSDESIFETESRTPFERYGSITDGDDDNHRTLQSTVQWILERESNDAELPNFWLIMTITGDYVIVYFHCRFLEIKKKEIEDYILVRETVIRNIKNLCKVVNQKMLLDDLHDTRLCDKLLVPDPQQDESENETGLANSELNHMFVPGCFACNVVWETKFILHPRLKMSPIKGAVSRGIQALCSALSGFSVTNRKNLFVYKDINKNVFYLRLYESLHGCSKNQENEEALSGSFSRTSSFTSLSKKQFEEQLPFLLDETRLQNKSFSDTSENNLLRSEDFITLKVYGITEAGNDIKTDLVQVLQNRLDDAVLDVISALLSRNSLCKLLSEDVHFIQKPNQLPSCVLQFSVHDWVIKHLYSFRYLIKQNVQLLASLPKYSDPRSSFHFQDYSVPEDSPRRISEHDIFLYNQIPTCGKGIACLAFTIVNANGDCVECVDEIDLNLKTLASDAQSLEELKLTTETNILSAENSNEDLETRIEFRIWKQGKINMDVLESKLILAIKHALWELSVERNLLKYPIFEFESVHLLPVYHTLMPAWMKFGTSFGVPSIRLWEISVPIRSNLSIILKKLNSCLFPYEISCYAFRKQCPGYEETKKEIYEPCTCFDDVIQHSGDICLVVGRNLSLILENTEYIKNVSLEGVKIDKPIQRLPSSSQEEIQVQLLKQKFILIVIGNSKIKMYIYNWSKDKVENLTKYTTNLCEWLHARSCLLSSIVQQKMGLFYNLPIQRPDLPKKISEMTTSGLDVLMKFPVTFHKSNTGLQLSHISDSFRDIRLSKATRDKLEDKNPFIQNVNQLQEIQKIDRKTQHKHLHSLRQAKASATNTSVSEEMLNNFSLQGRLIHYVLTPLLFMPSWRVQAAATRDHSLSLRTQSDNEELVTSDVEEKWKWHAAICLNFINEYKQYLQSMGFYPVQKPSEQTSKTSNSVSPFENENKNIHYLQKYLLGGVLLYELSFSEPFFNAKLYAWEYARLNTKNNVLLSQFTVNFLDECDRIKFLMHLHSFTYDYHLRCLHQFITDQQPSLRHGYHMVDFLDDFIKYYPKAPNYARNLVHAESVSVNDVPILPTQLFDYLLTNGKIYNMESFCMTPQYSSNDVSEDNEYVLIRSKSTSAVCYKDVNDVEQSEGFDIVIIISHINDSQEKTITFQVYILITSRRELYPKIESEQKLGKFRTVSTSYDYQSSNEEDIDMKFSIYEGSGSSKESQDLHELKKKKTSHVEIKQEFVNYLGYYSSHEEAMQNLMMDEVEDAKKFIEWMVVQGAFDCETHILWNRLLCPSTSPLSYQELQHLVSLADVYEISTMDTQLSTILRQPISWLQSFVKALVAKLPECCHLFSSGNMQELLILHPQYSNGFVMLLLNLQKNTCTMNLVYRKGMCNGEETQFELQTFFEQIINTYCFHLWLDAF